MVFPAHKYPQTLAAGEGYADPCYGRAFAEFGEPRFYNGSGFGRTGFGYAVAER